MLDISLTTPQTGRRTRSELVVDEEELGETEREGVRMEFLASPIEVIGDAEGNVSGVKFVRNRLGEPDATGAQGDHPGEALGDVAHAQDDGLSDGVGL